MAAHRLILCSAIENDLFRVLRDNGYQPERCESPAIAVRHASPGSAVLILADEYPKPSPPLSEKLLAAAAQKGLRLYVEYPETVPGLAFGPPRLAERERLVVVSDLLGPGLARGTILVEHGCWFLPTAVAEPHLVIARVAGYRRLVYGLPAEAFPILFDLPGWGDVLVATTKLSQFVTGRYAPACDWKVLWEFILCRLLGGVKRPRISWTPSVRPRFGPRGKLPRAVEADAFRCSIRWFRGHVVYGLDEKRGAIEGFSSSIDHLGRQLRRTWPRNDCIGETAMAFAWDWVVSGNPESRRLAGQMLDYIWSEGDFLQSDPKSPAYGLVNWYDRGPIFYGDDNARSIFGALVTARLTGETRWDALILRCLLANLRTTGKFGFRRNSLNLEELSRNGWHSYFEESPVIPHPHYQAYLWAAFIWAYALTGHAPFLERAGTAVRMTMEIYPKWPWTNGFTQELARMLLPLAWLVRVEDTIGNREMLARIADDLLAEMQPCGAIGERMGPMETGRYPSPRSNEDYGKDEAALIQEPGDPACDLLYTVNFALLGLHEAATATGERRYARAADRLTEFLCRVQVRSDAHAEIDGAWFRAFDYRLWEHFGSSADVSWGAWCAESGWTNAWIAAVLAMRGRGETLFDLRLADRLKPLLPGLIAEMFY